jgi:putative oxidoreductase
MDGLIWCGDKIVFMRKIFSFGPIQQPQALAIIRIIFGALMIYHGKEIFQPDLMKTYAEWDMFKGPNGLLKVYIGKTSEFVAGLSLLFGLFTRLGALLTAGTFVFITFFVGNGRFWYEDQHPFMFGLLGAIYFFNGPGAWSLDALIFGGTKKG